jgi:hypothetical protein
LLEQRDHTKTTTGAVIGRGGWMTAIMVETLVYGTVEAMVQVTEVRRDVEDTTDLYQLKTVEMTIILTFIDGPCRTIAFSSQLLFNVFGY